MIASGVVPGPYSEMPASGTMVSRLTGLFRILVLAWVLGFTPIADSFNLANTVPNMLFDLVLGGVAGATFIPVFVERLALDGERRAWRSISSVVTGALIVLSAAVMRLRWRSAISVVLRDAHLQPSPNAGYPEAALAGALGVRLGGLNYYFGHPVRKPFLGDPLEDLKWNRFSQVRLMLYLVTMVSYCLVGIWLRIV